MYTASLYIEVNNCIGEKKATEAELYFTKTAEIHACLLAYFYGQYADRYMNLKSM